MVKRRNNPCEKRIDRAVGKYTGKQFRMAMYRSFFRDFVRPHSEWIMEMVRIYLEQDNIPLSPITLLPQYYDSPDDKIVAAFIGTMIPDNCDVPTRCNLFHRKVKSPMQYIMSGAYNVEKFGYMRDRSFYGDGKRNREFAKLFDRLRDIISPVRSLKQYYSAADYAPMYKLTELDIGITEPRIDVLRLFLLTSDGVGEALWGDSPQDVKCPLTKPVIDFAKIWNSKWRLYLNKQDAIDDFCLPHGYYMYYAADAYRKLRRRSPEACSRYSTWFKRRIERGSGAFPAEWREILPDLSVLVDNE